MKVFAPAAVLLTLGVLTCMPCRAGDDLAGEFIAASHAEDNLGALQAGYVEQFSTKATPEARANFARHLNASMSWNLVKDRYATLVAKTYSDDELRAAISFLQTPVGKSFAAKGPSFQEQLGLLLQANAEDFTKEAFAPPPPPAARPPGAPMLPGPFGMPGSATAADLDIKDTEERKVGGGVHLLGMIENHGKFPARSVQIEADLFLKGKFVDQCIMFVPGMIDAGATRFFKIQCGSKDMPPERHDSVKYQVLTMM